MHRSGQAQGMPAGFLDPAKVFLPENGHGQARFYSLRNIIGKEPAKHEDTLGDAAFSEIHPLLEPGDGKHVAPFPGKPFGDRYRAMPVSIRLDYRNKRCGPNLFANASDIVGKVIQVYFRISPQAHKTISFPDMAVPASFSTAFRYSSERSR